MGRISVAEAARHLGVGERRVLQRIADGSLRAERIGQRWAIDERDLLPLDDQRDPGRPISERSAWAIIAAAFVLLYEAEDRRPASDWLTSLAPSERSRAQNRLHNLLADHPHAAGEEPIAEAASRLRALLGNRADRVLLHASPRDLGDLRDDGRLALAGLSSPDSGVVAGDLVEAYLDAANLDALLDHYLLDKVQREADANVILHVVPDDVAQQAPDLWRAAAGLPLLLAVDLAEHRRPREQARAADLVAELHDHVMNA